MNIPFLLTAMWLH